MGAGIAGAEAKKCEGDQVGRKIHSEGHYGMARSCGQTG